MIFLQPWPNTSHSYSPMPRIQHSIWLRFLTKSKYHNSCYNSLAIFWFFKLKSDQTRFFCIPAKWKLTIKSTLLYSKISTHLSGRHFALNRQFPATTAGGALNSGAIYSIWSINPLVPESLIRAFRPLRRDCTRLRRGRMSLIVPKGHSLKLEYLSNHTYSHNLKKVCAMIFTNFTIFRLRERIAWDWDDIESWNGSYPRFNSWYVLTLFSRLYGPNLEICVIWPKSGNLTDFPASIYVKKAAARSFDTIRDILRSLSLAQSLFKGRNAQIWHMGNRVVNVRKIILNQVG